MKVPRPIWPPVMCNFSQRVKSWWTLKMEFSWWYALSCMGMLPVTLGYVLMVLFMTLNSTISLGSKHTCWYPWLMCLMWKYFVSFPIDDMPVRETCFIDDNTENFPVRMRSIAYKNEMMPGGGCCQSGQVGNYLSKSAWCSEYRIPYVHNCQGSWGVIYDPQTWPPIKEVTKRQEQKFRGKCCM